jgi:formyltetrahydrofolate-dependent phosphoribosylglycinamide formyltransferase
LGVLGSTRGSDLVPIVEAINSGKLRASVEVIISNNKGSLILEKAEKYKIPSAFIGHKGKERLVFDREVDKKLSEKKVDLVLLIGFMRILSKEFVRSWEGQIINVHPSLLPKYAGGINNDVHRDVLQAKDKETGCTIHLVTSEVDRGPIVVQKKCVVLKTDTVDSLKERVQSLEGVAFIEAINKMRGILKNES